MTFELLTTTAAKIDSVNNRAEMRGKEAHPAVDLRISFDSPNSVLSMFDGWLLTMLYHKAGPDAPQPVQDDLEGIEQVSDAPNLRMPLLASPLRWGKDYTGYELTIDYGLGGKSNVELTDCAINSVQIAPKEGGTVTITFRVQCSNGLTERVLGKLAALVQHDVHILLKAPEARQESIEPQRGDNSPFPTDLAATDATGAFMAAHSE